MKMSEKSAEFNGNGDTDEQNGNSALDWEIFDILCRDELGLSVSFNYSNFFQKFFQLFYSIELNVK